MLALMVSRIRSPLDESQEENYYNERCRPCGKSHEIIMEDERLPRRSLKDESEEGEVDYDNEHDNDNEEKDKFRSGHDAGLTSFH